MANYYISPTGDDATGDGSIGNPWKSFTKADNYLTSPGDTLYCRGGEYTAETDIFYGTGDGTPGNPITVRNYPGETPVFRAISSGTGYPVLYLVYKDYYVFEGLEFRPISESAYYFDSFPFYLYGNNITVKNCVFVGHLLTQGPMAGYYTWIYKTLAFAGSQIEVDSCVCDGNGYPVSPGDSGGHVFLGGCTNVRIHNCQFSRGVHDCISVWSNEGVEIFDNVFTHTIGYAIALHDNNTSPTLIERNSMTGANEVVNYEKSPLIIGGNDAVIRYNSMFGNGFVGVDFFCNGVDNVAVGNHVFNNVVWNSGRAAVYILSGPNKVSDTVIINNVFAHNMLDGSWGGTYTRGEVSGGNSNFDPVDNNIFHNNFIVCYVSGAWENDYSLAVYETTGSYKAVSYMEANYAAWVGNIYNYADPLFTDPDNGNFAIAAGSCLIDQGRDLTTITSSSGSGTQVVVGDSGFFWYSGFDGTGDQIIINGDLAKVRTITAIDRVTDTLTLNSSVAWTQGDSVNIYKSFSDPSTVRYSGTGPDIGVFEFTGAAPPSTKKLLLRKSA